MIELDKQTKHDIDPGMLLTKDGDFAIQGCYEELGLEETPENLKVSSAHADAIIGLQAIRIKELKTEMKRADLCSRIFMGIAYAELLVIIFFIVSPK